MMGSGASQGGSGRQPSSPDIVRRVTGVTGSGVPACYPGVVAQHDSTNEAARGAGMADDRDARIAQLEAQVRQFQNLYAATLTKIDVLRTELRQQDDRPVEDTADGLVREAYDRLYGTAMEEARPEAPLDYEQLVVELERRTRELTEARGQQTATAEILRAIAAA